VTEESQGNSLSFCIYVARNWKWRSPCWKSYGSCD